MKTLLDDIEFGVYKTVCIISDFLQFIREKLFYIFYDEDTLCKYGFHKQENIVLETSNSLDGEKMYVKIGCKNCNNIFQSYVAEPHILKRRLIK